MELSERIPGVVVDEVVLSQAEADIDNIIGIFNEGGFRKAFWRPEFVGSVVITATTATLSSSNTTNGYYARTVLEILSGDNAGSRIFVDSSVNNVLTFESQTIAGTFDCRIYQLAKAPFLVDSQSYNNNIYKTISEDIKQAVAYQYQFRLKNKNILDSNFATKKYSVDKDKYEEEFDTIQNNTINQRISSQAIDVISYLITHI